MEDSLDRILAETLDPEGVERSVAHRQGLSEATEWKEIRKRARLNGRGFSFVIDELGDPLRAAVDRAAVIHQDCGPRCTVSGEPC